LLPAADALYINQIMVYDFHNPVPDDVHPLQNPNLKEIQTFGEES
jgi:hypothetical protein